MFFTCLYSVKKLLKQDFTFKRSHLALFCKNSFLGRAFTWEFEVFWRVKPHLRKDMFCREWRHAGKVVPLKICLFGLDIGLLWILIEGTNSEHPWKIRYFGKNWHIFLKYSNVPLWYLLAPWNIDGVLFLSLRNWQAGVYNGLINRDGPFNHLFWVYCSRTPEFFVLHVKSNPQEQRSNHRCQKQPLEVFFKKSKVSLRISQNSQENTCARVSFLVEL